MARTTSIVLLLAAVACGSQTPDGTTATPASEVSGHPEPFDSGASGASAQDRLRSDASASERSRRAATPTATPTATSTSTASPTASPTPAEAPTPSALTLAKQLVAVEPSGELPLARDEETVVDPASSFRVVLSAALDDARLVVLDGGDALVPAKGTREVGATTTLTVAPTAPLRPGSKYHLRLEGVRTREVHDAGGVAYAPFAVPVLAAGTPPPPEPPAKKKRGRR